MVAPRKPEPKQPANSGEFASYANTAVGQFVGLIALTARPDDPQAAVASIMRRVPCEFPANAQSNLNVLLAYTLSCAEALCQAGAKVVTNEPA